MRGSSEGKGFWPLAVFVVFSAQIVVGAPASADAAVAPFALLIEDGGSFTTHARGDGLTVFVSVDRPVWAVINGQKSPTSIGTAVIYVWQRAGPGPFAGSFGPIAGLGIVKLGAPFAFKIHWLAPLLRGISPC